MVCYTPFPAGKHKLNRHPYIYTLRFVFGEPIVKPLPERWTQFSQLLTWDSVWDLVMSIMSPPRPCWHKVAKPPGWPLLVVDIAPSGCHCGVDYTDRWRCTLASSSPTRGGGLLSMHVPSPMCYFSESRNPCPPLPLGVHSPSNSLCTIRSRQKMTVVVVEAAHCLPFPAYPWSASITSDRVHYSRPVSEACRAASVQPPCSLKKHLELLRALERCSQDISKWKQGTRGYFGIPWKRTQGPADAWDASSMSIVNVICESEPGILSPKPVA